MNSTIFCVKAEKIVKLRDKEYSKTGNLRITHITILDVVIAVYRFIVRLVLVRCNI